MEMMVYPAPENKAPPANQANQAELGAAQQHPPAAQGTVPAPGEAVPVWSFFVAKNRLKNRPRKLLIGLILSLSAIIFGYSLKEITSVPIKKIVQQYNISMDPFSAQSILIGILPLGSVLGAIATKFMIKRLRRLHGMYIFTLINIVAVVLVNITTFGTLVAGRFIQGICVGYYTSIGPLYLKEIAPKELRRMLGLFFSFGKIVGVMTVIILELIFDAVNLEIGWRVLFSMTAGFSVLQAVLVFFFANNTPTELIEKGEHEEARKVIQKLYMPEHVEDIYNQYQREYLMELAQGKETQSQNLNKKKHKDNKIQNQDNVKRAETLQIMKLPTSTEILAFERDDSRPQVEENRQTLTNLNANAENSDAEIGVKDEEKLTYEQKKRIAYWVGVHLCVLRHFLGGNTIISQGGVFITYFNSGLGYYTPVIINSVQFLFVVVDVLWIQRTIGKRPLFLISISGLSVLNMAVAISMIFQDVIVAEVLFCIYMVVYGGAFISPIWAYPSEVIPASQALFSNIMHWIALSISTLIPPLVSKIMPHSNPYPVFIFYSLYGVLGFIHIYRYLRQSDGLTFHEIITSYR